MALALTVTPSGESMSVEPKADVRMVLREYAFDIAPEITAGRHTIRVENAGIQPHHVALVRLQPGRTAAEALEWAKEMKGPPPDEPI